MFGHEGFLLLRRRQTRVGEAHGVAPAEEGRADGDGEVGLAKPVGPTRTKECS